MVNNFTDETFTADVASVLAGDSSLESLQLQYSYEDLKQIAPLLATSANKEQAKASSASAHSHLDKSAVINRANLPALKAKFNKYIYASAPAETNFQIGPLTFGSEVQSIKIIEQKAIGIVQGVRSGTDFVVDNGAGDADVHATLLLSGHQHILDALRPLIALFRLSPITSVKNDIIKQALYNDFSENQVPTPEVQLLENARLEIELAFRTARRKELLQIVRRPQDNEISFDLYKEAIEKGFPKLDDDIKVGYEKFLDSTRLQDLKPSDLKDQFQRNDVLNEHANENLNENRVDRTGYVPMALIGIELQTHPELPEAMIINLYMKRIDVGNFLTDFLQYRDVDGLPTADARDAFWLNRAIDLYVDTILPETFLGSGAMGGVTMHFQGDDVELEQFKRSNDLKAFKLDPKGGPDSTNKTAIGQMSYGVYNKFKFCRLLGKSYPTAQYMGSTSGTLRMNIKTSDDLEFERIHAYKSAADFFVRHTERFTRFNGWVVDSVFTRLLNFNPLGFSQDAYNQSTPDVEEFKLKRSFYPTQVVSTTDDQLPGTKHIVMEFKETNPDFFEEFGFTIKKGGYQVGILHEFFEALYERAETVRVTASPDTMPEILKNDSGQYDMYAFETFFGFGNADYKVMLLNPDTIIAAMLEPTAYQDGNYISNANLPFKLMLKLAGDERLSGIIEAGGSALDVIEEEWDSLSLAFSGPLYLFNTEIEIPIQLARELMDEYFVFRDSENVPVVTEAGSSNETVNISNSRDLLEKLIIKIAEPDARDELYKYLVSHNEVGFTDTFIQKLFTSIVKRRKVPITDRLYNRGGVISAFKSLSIALEARGQAFISEEALEPMSKKGSSEDKIIVGTDGRLKVGESQTTSYNDFFFLSYEELFNLVGTGFEDEDNWKKFAPTFNELGIVHFDVKTIEDKGFTDEAVTALQNQRAVILQSPVPPSVFFYRENELEEMRISLKTEYTEWFDKMKSFILDIPYDIERATRDIHGRDTGSTEIAIDDNELVKKIGDQTSTRIEKMVERYRIKRPEEFRNTQRDIILQQVSKLIEAGKYEEQDIVQQALDGSLDDEFFKEVSWFSETARDGVILPHMLGTTLNSPVAKYNRVTGLAGEGILRTVVFGNEVRSFRNKEFRELVTSAVTTSAAGGLNGITVSDAHLEEVAASFLKITQAMPDNGNDIVKAFPTMRLYLIEDTGPNLVIQDNFYGYHAIESIDITLDKYDASLAVIRIADPFHMLQGTAFSITDKGNIDKQIALPTNAEYDESLMERIKLRQGRSIQIRGGYSADPDHLDTLFTGRIAELQFGDVITVVAQGWKAELMGAQVEFEVNSVANSSVKDLVVKTVRGSNPKGFGEVYSGNEYQAIKNIAFDLGIEEEVGQMRTNSLGTHNGGGASGLSAGIFGFTLIQNLDAGLDTRLRNIWVPDNNRERFQYFKDITQHGWQGSRWVVPLTPAWEVLQNAAKYVWGYICQVVPYDGEATIFFGRPEQLYYHTGGRRNVGKAFRHLKQNSIAKVTGNWDDLMKPFFSSTHYNKDLQVLTKYADTNFLIENSPGNYLQNAIDIKFDTTSPSSAVMKLPSGFHSYMFYVKFTEHENTVGLAQWFRNDFADLGFVETALEERLRLIKRDNLSQDFYSRDFEDIVNFIGNRQLVSRMMLSSFYGLSSQYVQKNVTGLEGFVRSMLEPMKDNGKSITLISNALNNWYTADEIQEGLGKGILESMGLTYERADGMLKSLQNTSEVDKFTNYLYSSANKGKGFASVVGDIPVNNFIEDGEVLPEFMYAMAIYWDSTEKQDSDNYGLTWAQFLKLGTGKGKAAYADSGSNHGDVSLPSISVIISNAITFYSVALAEKDLADKNKAALSAFFDNDIFAFHSRKLGNPTLADDLFSSNKEQMKELFIDNLWKFRAFVHYFARYIRDDLSTFTEEAAEAALQGLRDDHTFDPKLIHNMKVFRDYHYITDEKDIISNDIAATTREMHNTVIVRYPAELVTSNNVGWIPDFIENRASGDDESVQVSSETSWVSWPAASDGHVGMQFDDSLTLEDKKVLVHTDLNVTRKEQAALVGTNVLTEAMRSMYRNKVTILGRSIKPWDYVMLNDKYTDMHGLVDVERVVHHYSASDGWITNIVPHAACEANPGNRNIQAAVFASKMDRIFETTEYAFNALLIISFIPSGGSSVALGSAIRGAFANASGNALKRGGKALAASSVSAQMQIMKKTLFSDSKKFLRNYMITEGLLYGGTYFNRLIQTNMRAGKDSLPVMMMPLQFKGAPLQAGMHGSDLTYWSLGSRAHWARKHLMDSVSDLWSLLTDFDGPQSSDRQILLERLAGVKPLSSNNL